MDINIRKSWQEKLQAEFEQPYFKELMDFVELEYQNNICYPEKSNLFSAFNYFDFNEVKVVILGQDPYHGPNQAHGLCFSVQEGVKIPPSLRNMFKEIKNDLGKETPQSGNLENWAKQGVLLLNATFSVRENQPKSHQKKGWEKFTDQVIQLISEQKENVVFLLWGGAAKKKGKKIDREKHLVLESGHPSPLSAIRGHWFNNKHFSKTNTYLKRHDKKPINW